MSIFQISLFVFLTSKVVLSQNNDYFVHPPSAGKELFFVENPTYNAGDKVTVQWVTAKAQYSIWLWQQSLTAGSAVLGQTVYTKILGGPELGTFNWTATTESFDLSQSNVFFFALGPSESITSNTTTSHYFNLTASAKPEITSSSAPSATQSSTTTGSLSSPTSNSNSTAAQTTTVPNNNQSGDSGGMSAGERVGLGVGVGIGVPTLAIFAFLLGRYARRRSSNEKFRSLLVQSTGDVAEHNRSSSPKEVSGVSHINNAKAFGKFETAQFSSAPVELPVERPAFRST